MRTLEKERWADQAEKWAEQHGLQVPITNDKLKLAVEKMGGTVLSHVGKGKTAICFLMEKEDGTFTLTMDDQHKDGTYAAMVQLMEHCFRQSNPDAPLAKDDLAQRELYRYLAACVMMPKNKVYTVAVEHETEHGNQFWEKTAAWFNVTPELMYRRMDALGVA